MPIKETPKAKQTREHILNTALELFAAKGYQETTMRDIAAAADCSLGLAYRYFAQKEEMILALYERLTIELREEVSTLPPETLAQRFSATVRACLARLALHRATMGALFGAGIAPDSPVAVLGDQVAGVRTRVWQIFLTVIEGAKDAPREKQARDLATVFYAVHLTLVLFWIQDRSPQQQRTEELLKFSEETLGRMRPLLNLPPVTKSLARLSRILMPMFGPSEGVQ